MDKVKLAIAGVLLSLVSYFVGSVSIQNKLGNLPYSVGRPQTTTSVVVGPQQNKTLFSARNMCADRVISTANGIVMLSFDGSAPTGSVGHSQLASTTIAYDSDRFGCSDVIAFGYASTTITVTEFLW